MQFEIATLERTAATGISCVRAELQWTWKQIGVQYLK